MSSSVHCQLTNLEENSASEAFAGQAEKQSIYAVEGARPISY